MELSIEEKTKLMRSGELQMSRDREYWTDDERDTLRREYAKGTSINEIALMLERSESAIYQQIERLSLCIRNPFSARKKTVVDKNRECLCKSCKCDRSECPRCKVYQAVLEAD